MFRVRILRPPGELVPINRAFNSGWLRDGACNVGAVVFRRALISDTGGPDGQLNLHRMELEARSGKEWYFLMEGGI